MRSRHPQTSLHYLLSQEVYDVILQHLKEDERKLAVDVATGSGQAAVQLADFFTQVCIQHHDRPLGYFK